MFASGTNIFLPLAALVFCSWSWKIQFETRLWLGFAIGLVTDTIQLVPFGTGILTFLTSALLCEFFQLVFSNTESRITYGISIVLLTLVFLGTFPLYRALL